MSKDEIKTTTHHSLFLQLFIVGIGFILFFWINKNIFISGITTIHLIQGIILTLFTVSFSFFLIQRFLREQHIDKLHLETRTQLIKSNNSLKIAEKLGRIGHWEHDILNDALTWSDEVYRIFNLDHKSFLPSYLSFIQLIHPDDRDLVAKTYLQAIDEKKVYDITHRVILNNGNIKYVHERCITTYDENDIAIRSIGTIQDITKRVEVEENSKLLATAIEQTVDVIVITNPEGIIKYVNPAFEQLTGYSKQEAIGLNPAILQSGEHPPSFYKNLWKTISSGKVWHGKFTNKTKSGALFIEEASITPIKDKSGTITNFIAVKHDISRELNLEKQLQHAAKMEAIGTLANGISHDFNNILGAILGYTRMAMDELPKESQPYQDLSHVILSGDRAANLIKQLLLFSRHQKQGFIPVQIQLLIEDALKLLRPSLPVSISLKVDIAPDCLPVMADPTQIHQVIGNLCNNGIQAMLAKGGTLGIHLTMITFDSTEDDAVAGLIAGEYIKLTVSDTGDSIEKEHLSRIFEPFFTTKSLNEGTGLGLAVSSGIIKSHKGSIIVESVQGKGTTFTTLLPAIAAKNNATPQQCETAATGGKEHIVIVDDEHAILAITEQALTKLGYRISSFSCSIEALSSFRENPFQYDLLVTDMSIPKMNGAKLAEQIKAIRPDIPVIMCTGQTDIIDEHKARQCGIRAFLSKPIKQVVLAKTIRKILD